MVPWKTTTPHAGSEVNTAGGKAGAASMAIGTRNAVPIRYAAVVATRGESRARTRLP